MTPERTAHTDILKLAAEDLVDRGYQVFFEPGPSLLPAALKQFRPDGIAIGKSPNLVIEVASESAQSQMRVEKLQNALKEVQGWQLHLIVDRGDPTALLDTFRLSIIADALGHASHVKAVDTRSALLTYWACFEALARAIDPKMFARPQTPGRIIEQFATLGYVVPEDADFLRTLAKKRNEFIHGKLLVDVELVELSHFHDILRSLLQMAHDQGVK